MSWSVTVVDPDAISVTNPFGKFDEEWSRENAAYPIDAAIAFEAARKLSLSGVTLSGGRTPIIGSDGGPDEIVVVTITGSAKSTDFLALMHGLVSQGPGADTPVAQHYRALALLREKPCQHEFEGKTCLKCGVHFEGGLFSFEPGSQPEGK